MRKIILILLMVSGAFAYSCTSVKGNQDRESSVIVKDSATQKVVPEHLTYETFLKKVWNFEKHPQEWVYEGKEPCVIDFYADWCGPCRRVAPIMEELAEKYKGKVKIYKVNVDKESKLAAVFQIRSIPTVLFIPQKDRPMKQVGLLPHDAYVQIINEKLLHIQPKQKK
jgi:thioredoxin